MHTQHGVSFMEILISLFIVSVFLLGFDAMQIASLREVKSAYYSATAITQLNNMAARIHVSKAKNSDAQIIAWNNQIKTVLPQGLGLIEKRAGDVVLSVLWGDEKLTTCSKNKIGLTGCLTVVIKILEDLHS